MIYEFPKKLAEEGMFNKKLFEKIDKWIKLYLKGKETYRKIALEIPKIYSKGMKDVKEDDTKKEAKKFVDFYLKKFIQPYTTELVKLMKTYGITIGISGSPIEVVGFVGKIFGFDITYGTELEVKNSVYTGRIKQNLIIRESKEKVLERIIKENKIDVSKSYGFGDTEQDLSVLSKVGNPVALNPNKELLSTAQKNGWMIFNSDDDIINVISKKLISK